MIISCPACMTRFNVDGSKLAATGTRVRCAQCGHLWLQTPEGPLAAPPAAPKPAAAPPSPPPPEPEAPPRAAPQRLVEPKPVPKPTPPAPARAFGAEPPAEAASGRAPPPPPTPKPPPGAPPGFKSGRKPESDRFSASEEPAPAPPAKAPAPRKEDVAPVRARATTPADGAGRIVPVPEASAKPERKRRPGLVLALIGLVIVLLLGGAGAAYLFREDIVRFWPRTAFLFELVDADVNVIGITFRNVTYTRPFEDGVPAIEVHGELVNERKTAAVIPRLRAALLDAKGHELYHWFFTADATKLEPRAVTPFASRLPSPPADARDLEIRFVHGNE